MNCTETRRRLGAAVVLGATMLAVGVSSPAAASSPGEPAPPPCLAGIPRGTAQNFIDVTKMREIPALQAIAELPRDTDDPDLLLVADGDRVIEPRTLPPLMQPGPSPETLYGFADIDCALFVPVTIRQQVLVVRADVPVAPILSNYHDEREVDGRQLLVVGDVAAPTPSTDHFFGLLDDHDVFFGTLRWWEAEDLTSGVGLAYDFDGQLVLVGAWTHPDRSGEELAEQLAESLTGYQIFDAYAQPHPLIVNAEIGYDHGPGWVTAVVRLDDPMRVQSTDDLLLYSDAFFHRD